MALLHDLILDTVKHTKLFYTGQTGFVWRTQRVQPGMLFPSLISRNTWEKKQKKKKFKKSLATISVFSGTKAKQSTRYPGMWIKSSREGQNPTAYCIFLGRTSLQTSSVPTCPLRTINQAGPLPPPWGSAALSTVSVISNNEWEEALAKITWGHKCSGCNGPDSKQLHRLDPYILTASKTQGELSRMSLEAFCQPEFDWAQENNKKNLRKKAIKQTKPNNNSKTKPKLNKHTQQQQQNQPNPNNLDREMNLEWNPLSTSILKCLLNITWKCHFYSCYVA